ncbi:hypothetical protein HID58_014847 [Brassica napus]|uniref:(rape) hypothetical protein n=1 Tax=Brassica napus TaxID=3708 RepID=A0A817ALF4_BRANA|nr:hypothetical protein HID58_014847 [Brassica napus]CAF2271580.1 unnamed protein product [Brassica napus]
MAGEDWIELKFKFADGLKIIKRLYCGKKIDDRNSENIPKTLNDVKLINAGKILDNNRTLAESTLPVGELPGMVITMHVVLRPPTLDKKSRKCFFAFLLC